MKKVGEKTCYEFVKEFKRKYPMTVAFRLKKHSKVIESHLNPDEKILYAFPAQKNASHLEIFYTNVVALTNKRLLIATKRVLWGYFFVTVTPDMFNDLTIRKGIFWGSLLIDTVKEKVVLSNIDPNALPELETVLSEYMMEEKRKYINEASSK